VLGELGIDSLREGERLKGETLAWQIEDAFRGGLAGTVIFTYPDEWFRGGHLVEDWKMGLVTSDRRVKESFSVVRKAFQAAPYFPAARSPKVSVVVASYNAQRTLPACLESLKRLNYPDYEVVLVDDGSTDGTAEFVKKLRGTETSGEPVAKTDPEEAGSRVRSPHPSESDVAGSRVRSPHPSESDVAGSRVRSPHPSESDVAGSRVRSPHPSESDVAGSRVRSPHPSESDIAGSVPPTQDSAATGRSPRPSERSERAGNLVCLRHDKNLGLSAARNTGIAAASGEIIAFTDADCRADADWLYYLVGDLLNSACAGVGGPNLLPPEDSSVAAAVMVSPGGPAPVMLTDRRAEHIPGCNMAFYKWLLEELGGFDPVFRQAGDDVDLCWRLQQAGYEIGFSPAAFVWHYRRSTVGAYLKQQRGYGEAEALLVQKHPENFNAFGGSLWRGRIYGPSKFALEIQPPVIYHGLFGSAGFQRLYASEPATMLMLCTTLAYHLFVVLPLWILSVVFHHLFPLAFASLLLPLGICAAAGAQAALPAHKKKWWSRPLVAWLFFLQPIVRGWARYRGRFALRSSPPLATRQSLDSLALRSTRQRLDHVQYWAEKRVDRLKFVDWVSQRLDEKGWAKRADVGWSEYDLEVYGSRWSHLQLTTVAEDHPENRQMIHCRLRTTWSLAARILFWTVVDIDLLVIGLVTSWRPWSWLLLLAVPLVVWLLRRNERDLKSVMAVFLDELAREHHLMKVLEPVREVGKPASPGHGSVGHPAPSQ
jgi:GT2 family glycosyltransferase